MKNSNVLMILLLSLFIIIGIINLICVKSINIDNPLLEEIKNLEVNLDSLNTKKDSVRTIVFTINEKIIKNEKHYEKVVDTIIANNDSSNFEWARNYIEKFINERTR